LAAARLAQIAPSGLASLGARRPYPSRTDYDILVMFAPLDRRGAKKAPRELGGYMARHLAFGGVGRPLGRSVSSMACLAFVLALGVAFWALAAWIGGTLLSGAAFN
jgi:hypothetical protein